jgi:hypothetical protein
MEIFMKKLVPLFVALLMVSFAAFAYAADIVALDKVNVLMPREKVLQIMGTTDEKTTTADGLTVEIYQIPVAAPLIHAGCIYDHRALLVGQSFVFQGNTGEEIFGRMQKHGYVPLKQGGRSLRLAGFDDDTSHPVVVVIEHHENLTTITTFEKSFYESRVK